ncbi:hypothetical protein H4582DRAFT_1929283 [Lactarius indigo]|nr:hypothetical protein H4582DRAFT_1929283 [Lactarius indigo]
MKGVDMGKVEQKIDRLLEAIEQERDLTQYIVHVDMDAFYANVELLENPNLAGKPFGVGHGVLCTASYEARKYGCHIALKLCPDLVLVDLHMSLYGEVSKNIMGIFRQYDPNMLAASVDEAYLNITEFCERNDLEPDECVQRMRQRVFDETKLTVSAGVAANKICSDKNKPNGQFHLPHTPEAIKEFIHGLSIRKIPGVGRVKERLLESIGVKTCGDIYNCRGVLALLDKHFGLHSLLRVYLGIASNVVQPWLREEKKSIGSERNSKILQAELEDDMERGGWTGRTVTLKYKLDTYEVFTRAKTFNRWIKTKYSGSPSLKILRKKDDGIAKFFEPLPDSKSPSKSRARDINNHDSGYDEDELLRTSRHLIKSELPSSEVHLQPTMVPPELTSAAIAGECPLCTRLFSDNDELNAHVDWCLSREAIRSAQAEGDKAERKKPERNFQNRKRKRRKLEE